MSNPPTSVAPSPQEHEGALQATAQEAEHMGILYREPVFKLDGLQQEEDPLQFGRGEAFDAGKVAQFLSLTTADVGRLSAVEESSVRWDADMPLEVRLQMEEVASTVNRVARCFSGDPQKTADWFRANNPLLGDICPRDMIRLGRHERLRRFLAAK